MTYQADPGMTVGHVHLKVADLDRAIDFYQRVLGLDLMQRYGDQAAFLSAGGYHHQLGLNTWHTKDGQHPTRNTTGLYHTAFLYPTRAALGRAVGHVRAQGVDIYGWSDHGVSLAVYFDDMEGNGIELYWDRPKEEWPWSDDGKTLAMTNDRFDLDALVAEGTAT